jgi:hypothetical protein
MGYTKEELLEMGYGLEEIQDYFIEGEEGIYHSFLDAYFMVYRRLPWERVTDSNTDSEQQ